MCLSRGTCSLQPPLIGSPLSRAVRALPINVISTFDPSSPWPKGSDRVNRSGARRLEGDVLLQVEEGTLGWSIGIERVLYLGHSG